MDLTGKKSSQLNSIYLGCTGNDCRVLEARQGLALSRSSCDLPPLHFLLPALVSSPGGVWGEDKQNNSKERTKPKRSRLGRAERRQIRSSCPPRLRAHEQSMTLKTANTELV